MMVSPDTELGRDKPIDFPWKDPPQEQDLEYEPNYQYKLKRLDLGYIDLQKFQSR